MNNTLVRRISKIIDKTKGKIISSKTLYKGNFINLLEEEYVLPNNKVIKREKIIKNNYKEAVIIIAKTINNKYILVFQNRINNTTIEFPSGYIEENENVEDASVRELLEEVGYFSDDIKLIDKYYNSIGIDGSTINIVIANNCRKVSSQNLGNNEYINYSLFTFKELKQLINDNYINTGGNRLAFYKLMYIKTTN